MGWGDAVVEEPWILHPISIHSARHTDLLLDEIAYEFTVSRCRRYLQQDDATVGILAHAVTWAIKSTTFGPLVTPQCLIKRVTFSSFSVSQLTSVYYTGAFRLQGNYSLGVAAF